MTQLSPLKNIQKLVHAGFTLIEMVVVVGIIVVITAVVLANNTKFGGRVLLENFVYDIALSIRQAQVYGISVVRFGSSNFTAAYGMHFDLASNASYSLFADAVTPNNVYENGELVQTTTLTRNFIISGLCVTPSSGPESCTPTITKLDVAYKRPEPDASIHANGNSATAYSSARIIVKSPRGDTMNVVVYSNGQISVTQ